MKLKRAIALAHDVMVVTGKSNRQSQRIFRKIKKYYRKERHQYVSLSELADYMGLKMDDLMKQTEPLLKQTEK